MAKKTVASRQPLHQAPPPADSSSSEDNNTNNNSSSSSSSDEEDTNHLPQTQTQSINKLINTPQPKPHVSDSSDASDTDTDTDTPPPKPAPSPSPAKDKAKKKPKPPVSDDGSDTDSDTDTPLAKVKASKPKVTIAALPSVKGSATPSTTAKKAKKEEGVAVMGTPGKLLFQRLFSEEDEIAILKGMIEYKEKKGWDPMADVDDFTRFIVERGLDVVELKREQVVNKVRRLKKKFQTAKKKKKISGSHDVKCFELSKKIWGSEEEGEGEEENGFVDVVVKKKKDEKKYKKGEGSVNNVVENGGEREEWRGVKRSERGGAGEKKKKAVKDELEEEILRLGGVQWSEMAGDVKFMDEETSVEVLERVKRRRLKKLEGLLEDLDEMRFVTLKAIESYKASMKE